MERLLRISRGVELMWFTMIFTSHCVKNSKEVPFGKTIRSIVCACSIAPFCPLRIGSQ